MSKPLWTSEDMEIACGGRATRSFTVTGGVSIDTRSLQPGDIFIALKDARDGHDFVETAFEKGASAALVSHTVCEHPQLVVKDVQAALEALGIAARARCAAKRVAVTGSVGKTSVKEMLARIFKVAGPAHANVKSFNNHWGVPLSLARMPEDTKRAVFEIGMSTPGEISPRSKMVRPDIAIITRIAGAHLEGLGTLEAVAREKADVFAGMEAGGVFILPADDDFLGLLSERARLLCPTGSLETFGKNHDATARITGYETDGNVSTISVDVQGQLVSVTLQAVGEHWAQNVAAALLAASQTGINLADCAAALSGFTPPPGRGTSEVLSVPDVGDITLIDDAYNANPESMRAALSALQSRGEGRRILALGEMLEIGAGADKAHADLAKAVAAVNAHIVFLAGDKMMQLAESLPQHLQQQWAPQADELWIGLKSALSDGDVILIKGSNASGMGKLADRLRQLSVATDKRPEDSAPSVAGA